MILDVHKLKPIFMSVSVREYYLFQGEAKLPSAEAMWEEIQAKREAMAKRYVHSKRHTIQVNYIAYMDELAECTGCRPNLSK